MYKAAVERRRAVHPMAERPRPDSGTLGEHCARRTGEGRCAHMAGTWLCFAETGLRYGQARGTDSVVLPRSWT
jgi:hypothetical protein